MEKQHQNLIDLIKSKKIERKLDITNRRPWKHNKNILIIPQLYTGKKLDQILETQTGMKKLINFSSDLSFELTRKYNIISENKFYIYLISLRNKYKTQFQKDQHNGFGKYQQITKEKHHFFDLCFYLNLKFKSADYIGFPGYEFWDTEKGINNEIENFRETNKLIQRI